MKHPDYREAYEAFVAKRPADFVSGRAGGAPPASDATRPAAEKGARA